MAVHLTLRRSLQRGARRSTPPGPALQSRASREAVAEALGSPLRPRLVLGSPDDAHEREADATADRIMRDSTAGPLSAAAPALQRKCADCEQEEQVQRATAAPEDEKKDDKDEEPVRRRAEPGGGAALADAAAAGIQRGRGGGESLPAAERGFFEPRFGVSFAGVRVHADGAAAQLSGQLGARAFAVGQDLFFAGGQYRPGTTEGRRLLAHELTHVVQQRQGAAVAVRRWNVGPAPAPHGWAEVSDPAHLKRLAEAEAIVAGAVASRGCRSRFEDQCSNGKGAAALQDAFDNAQVYLRPHDDNVFGEGEFGGHNLAFNLRAFRIGRYMMASTLLHEMFHNCDPAGSGTGRGAELSAENAVEACRIHTPWIDGLSPRRAAPGDAITITGWNFGPTQGPSDRVRIGGVDAAVVSWEFMAGTSSRVQIVATVPAGAGAGGVQVINNGVASNLAAFAVG